MGKTYEEFINGALDLKLAIDHKIEKVSYLQEICNKTTTSFSERVQSSPMNTREVSITKLADAKNELEIMIDDLERVEKEIVRFLMLNLKRTYADILIYKYIDDKTPMEIADIKSMTDGSVRNKLSKADKIAQRRYYETRGMKRV